MRLIAAVVAEAGKKALPISPAPTLHYLRAYRDVVK